jgi:hypothetical protein
VPFEQAGLLLVGGQNDTDGTGDIYSPELGNQTDTLPPGGTGLSRVCDR